MEMCQDVMSTPYFSWQSLHASLSHIFWLIQLLLGQIRSMPSLILCWRQSSIYHNIPSATNRCGIQVSRRLCKKDYFGFQLSNYFAIHISRMQKSQHSLNESPLFLFPPGIFLAVTSSECFCAFQAVLPRFCHLFRHSGCIQGRVLLHMGSVIPLSSNPAQLLFFP